MVIRNEGKAILKPSEAGLVPGFTAQGVPTIVATEDQIASGVGGTFSSQGFKREQDRLQLEADRQATQDAEAQRIAELREAQLQLQKDLRNAQSQAERQALVQSFNELAIQSQRESITQRELSPVSQTQQQLNQLNVEAQNEQIDQRIQNLRNEGVEETSAEVRDELTGKLKRRTQTFKGRGGQRIEVVENLENQTKRVDFFERGQRTGAVFQSGIIDEETLEREAQAEDSQELQQLSVTDPRGLERIPEFFRPSLGPAIQGQSREFLQDVKALLDKPVITLGSAFKGREGEKVSLSEIGVQTTAGLVKAPLEVISSVGGVAGESFDAINKNIPEDFQPVKGPAFKSGAGEKITGGDIKQAVSFIGTEALFIFGSGVAGSLAVKGGRSFITGGSKALSKIPQPPKPSELFLARSKPKTPLSRTFADGTTLFFEKKFGVPNLLGSRIKSKVGVTFDIVQPKLPKPPTPSKPITFTDTNLQSNLQNLQNRIKSGSLVLDISDGKASIRPPKPKPTAQPPQVKGLFVDLDRTAFTKKKGGTGGIQNIQTKGGQLQQVMQPPKQKQQIKVFQLVAPVQETKQVQRINLKGLQRAVGGAGLTEQQLKTFGIQRTKQQTIQQQLQMQKGQQGISTKQISITKQLQLSRQGLGQQQSSKQSFQQSLGQLSKSAFKSKQKIGLAQSFKQKEKLKQLSKLSFADAITQRQRVGQRERFRFPTSLRQKLKQREKPKRLRLKTKFPRSKSLRQNLFSVSVRRRGNFQPLASKVSLQKALSIGKGRVSRGLGATFKIQGPNLQQIGTPFGFRRGKGVGVFIEKKQFRLSTKGETSAIQRAKRRKRRK